MRLSEFLPDKVNRIHSYDECYAQETSQKETNWSRWNDQAAQFLAVELVAVG